LDTLLPQLSPKLSTVIALVSSQAIRVLLGTPSGTWHSHLVHNLHPYGDLGYISSRHLESQGQSLTLSQHVDRAALAFPTISYVFSPFVRVMHINN